MSENKYIIDKDSLTGIADAVRNKLGTGEATTDETTGEIVYPEDKGYYLKQETVAKISGFGWSQMGYSGNFGQWALSIQSGQWEEFFGEPWYSAEITLKGVSVTDDWYDMDVYGGSSGNSVIKGSFSNVRNQKYTVNSSDSSTYFAIYFSNKYSSGRYNGKSYLTSATIIFKDINGNAIIPKQTTFQYYKDTQYAQSAYLMTGNFLTDMIPEKIPFSINNIQDKITNYLKTDTLNFTINYEGLCYSYVSGDGQFCTDYTNKNNFLTLISLTSGQKIGFCIGETVSNRFRASFFSGKTYDDFSQYVMYSSSSANTIYSDGIGITGSSELSGDGLLKRFYYTAPADGVLVVGTSNEGKLAYLHVWEA